jgi:Protein of unknown function (DUF4007)
MENNKEKYKRISLSFHQSFVPERKYLSSMMKFAKQPNEADTAEIAEATGIPTGEHSGKVEPTINYLKGMGLLEVSPGSSSRWKLQQTQLGRIVFSEDQFISEGFTQWVLHLHLCRRNCGAEAWFAVFGESELELGKTFTDESIKSYLIRKYGKRSNVIGPLVRMYTTEASFLKCGALIVEGSDIRRGPAPCDLTHFPGYYFVFLSLWDDYFTGVQQVAFDDFEQKTRFFATTSWNVPQINRFIDQLADDGLIKIDRQTGSAIILRIGSTDTVLKNLYCKLP